MRRFLVLELLLYAVTRCGSDHSDTLEVGDFGKEPSRRWVDERIGTIFAAVDRIDIVNGGPWITGPDVGWLPELLRHRTVRWYDVDLSELCAPDVSECSRSEHQSGCPRGVPERWNVNEDGGYLIFGDLNALSRYVCIFDPARTYLLVNERTEPPPPVEQISQVLQSIWSQQGAFRVFVHLHDAVYGYDPFQPTGSLQYGALVELHSGGSVPMVPPDDFAGYPVRIEVFRSVYSNPVVDESGRNGTTRVVYRGPDVTARDVFSEVLNVTAVHVPADKDLFGDRLPNGSFSGALGRLIRREVDIVFTGFFIKDYSTRELDFTASLYSDAVCCLVKKASRIPEALLPLYIFPGDIWALLCLLGLFCASVWTGLRWVVGRIQPTVYGLWSQRYRHAVLFNRPRSLRRAGPGRRVLQIYVDTFILLVSAPYQRFTRSGAERVFLTGLLLVSLIFVSLYQSGLAAVFVNPLYHPDIGTLQQLEESGMTIPVKYRGFIDDVFAVNYSRLMDALRDRMRHLQVKESMLTRVARLGNIATVTRRTTLALDNAIYMTTKQLHMIPDCPRTYNLAYVMPRRSVFGERFNKVLLRLAGGGLVDHWIDVERYGWTLRDWRVVQGMMESNFKVLTVLDMQFAFYTLAIGLAVSVAVIGAELWHHRRRPKQPQGKHQT